MTRSARVLAAAGAVALLAAAGCGSSAHLSGNVSYDGQPVENGTITFVPADGRGPTAGALITQGRYRARDLSPGSKVVQIHGFRDVPMARMSSELAEQAEEAMRRGESLAVDPVDDATIIPPDAEGNNATVDIQRGRQTLDFHLKPPVHN